MDAPSEYGESAAMGICDRWRFSPLLWLGPKSAEDAQTMTLRHWLLNKEVPTFPLPGIYFFDAWRIRPSLEIPAKLTLGLTAVDLRHDEEMPPQPTAQDTSHGDRLLRRQEVLTARADAKTVAESAMEVSYVMQLSQALLEAGDTIQESTQARHRHLAVQKDHEEAKESDVLLDDARAAAPAALPQVAAMSHDVKTHLEECTTRYLGFKCFLFSVYRVYPEVEDGRSTLDLACAFAVLFGVGKPGSVLLTAEVVW